MAKMTAIPNGKMNLVHPSLEMSDPNPDVHSLFLQFNQLFFDGKLGAVSVQWSPRMTLCAGICRFRGKYGGCSIHLSKPLLSLRPRKDLVETLLHEMIHAYLFVADQNREREDHGPKFRDFMNRINGMASTNITVYHSFNDEVAHFKTHWWKCSGPCQSRPPYFGVVKRSMNRAPGPNDLWWSDHQRSCGGSFIKIKEPSPKKKIAKKKTNDENVATSSKKITDFFDKDQKPKIGLDGVAVFTGQGIKLGGTKRENKLNANDEKEGPPPKKKNDGKHRGDHPLLAMLERQRNNQGKGSSSKSQTTVNDCSPNEEAQNKKEKVKVEVQSIGSNDEPQSVTEENGIEDEKELIVSQFMDNLCPACGAFDITDLDLHLEVCPALVAIDIPVAAIASPVAVRRPQPPVQPRPVLLTDEERRDGILIDDDLPVGSSIAPPVSQPSVAIAGPSNGAASRQDSTAKVSCPICGTLMRDEAAVDAHLDDCLTQQSMGDMF